MKGIFAKLNKAMATFNFEGTNALNAVRLYKINATCIFDEIF